MLKFHLIIALLCTSLLFSQNQNQVEKSFIEVIGKSEKEVVPDEIYIDICLKERMENGEKRTLEQLENELKTTLRVIGIEEEHLFISDINAVLSKTGWWTKKILSTANYSLKINGADKLKRLFDCFEELKITEVNIIKATHSNIAALRKENRISAIKAAKEKADYLLHAIGEKTGKPIKINEITTANQQNNAFLNEINVVGYGETSKFRSTKNSVVAFEKIKISASIYVKFEIEK